MWLIWNMVVGDARIWCSVCNLNWLVKMHVEIFPNLFSSTIIMECVRIQRFHLGHLIYNAIASHLPSRCSTLLSTSLMQRQLPWSRHVRGHEWRSSMWKRAINHWVWYPLFVEYIMRCGEHQCLLSEAVSHCVLYPVSVEHVMRSENIWAR